MENRITKRIILLMAIIIITAISYSQPALKWMREYDNSDFDIGYDIAIDNSGNVYVTGKTLSNGCRIAKYDPNGIMQWEHFLGGATSGNKLIVDNQGNVFVFGEGSSSGPLFVQKISSNGTLDWFFDFSQGQLSHGQTAEMILWQDGNIYINAMRDVVGDPEDYNIYTAKLNGDSGNLEWQQSYTGQINPQGVDFGRGIQIDKIGNVYVAGTTEHLFNTSDVTLIKYDNNGLLLWDTIYAFPPVLNDYCDHKIAGIELVGDDGLFVAGYYQDSMPPGTLPEFMYELFILKYNTSGTFLWSKSYHRLDGWDQAVEFIYDPATQSFIMIANIEIYGSLNGSVLKFDLNGNLIWDVINDNSGSNDEFYDVAVDNTGNIYVTGKINGLITTIKYDTSGNKEWEISHGNFGRGHGIAVKENDVLGVTGFNTPVSASSIFTTLFYDGTTVGINETSDTPPLISIYPNPVSDIIKIESSEEIGYITIFDNLGRLIFKEKNDSQTFTINITEWKSGIYFIKLINSNGMLTMTKKLILK